MINIVEEASKELRPGGTIKFEGMSYGSMASFFHVKDKPGGGPPLHVHPYPETWVVLQGLVRFEVGGEAVEMTPGHIVVGPANTPHKFTNIGTDLLEMMCIHPSPVIIQEDLE